MGSSVKSTLTINGSRAWFKLRKIVRSEEDYVCQEDRVREEDCGMKWKRLCSEETV